MRQEIVRTANEQIDALNAEEKKLAELNAMAARDIEYYEKEIGGQTAPKEDKT